MSRRQRVICLTLACCASVALVIVFFLRRDQPDVRVVFIGYTNLPLNFGSEGSSQRYSGWIVRAVLEVTNSGSVPVTIASIWQAYPWNQISNHLGSYLMMQSGVLPPGKSEVVTMFLSSSEGRRRAEIAYTRASLAERLISKVRLNSAYVQSLTNCFSASPGLLWARSEWINDPHVIDPYVSRYHITAPPPDLLYDFSVDRPQN